MRHAPGDTWPTIATNANSAESWQAQETHGAPAQSAAAGRVSSQSTGDRLRRESSSLDRRGRAIIKTQMSVRMPPTVSPERPADAVPSEASGAETRLAVMFALIALVLAAAIDGFLSAPQWLVV